MVEVILDKLQMAKVFQNKKEPMALLQWSAIFLSGIFLGITAPAAWAKNEPAAKPAKEIVADDKSKTTTQSPAIDLPPAAFATKGFKVLAHKFDPKTHLHVWAVQHTSGTKTILYSTQSNDLFFTGALWDGQTGANISDVFYESLAELSAGSTAVPVKNNAPVVSAPAASAPAASVPGQIPAAIQRLAQLKGIREGADDIPLSRTIFVFFDPRCPYCKQFFEMTRNRTELKDKAIVWLPVIVLGNNARGEALTAEIMQSSQPLKTLHSVFAGSVTASAKPDESTLKALRENEAIFFTAFKSNSSAGAASVPVAFFVDRSGKAQMVPSPSDYFSKILAEMN